MILIFSLSFSQQREGLPQDKETFLLLVRELSQEFRKHNLYLSSAFGASKKIIDSAYNVKALAPYLDSMHIVSVKKSLNFKIKLIKFFLDVL